MHFQTQSYTTAIYTVNATLAIISSYLSDTSVIGTFPLAYMAVDLP